MKANTTHPKRRIAEKCTIGAMAVSLAVILIAGNPITFLLNAVPIVASFGLLLRFIRRYETSGFPLVAGAFAFAVVATGYVLRFHILWMFDVNGTKTAIGSAQAGLGFLFVPIEALFAGGAAFVAASLVSFGFYLLRERSR